jgi:hypothetical protein
MLHLMSLLVVWLQSDSAYVGKYIHRAKDANSDPSNKLSSLVLEKSKTF